MFFYSNISFSVKSKRVYIYEIDIYEKKSMRKQQISCEYTYSLRLRVTPHFAVKIYDTLNINKLLGKIL